MEQLPFYLSGLSSWSLQVLQTYTPHAVLSLWGV